MSKLNTQNTHIIPAGFTYHQPETVKEAVRLIAELDATPMAGGTDLICKMKQRVIEPLHIVNLKRIPELKGVEPRGEAVWIGAATKLRDIERSPLVQSRLPLLHRSVRSIGSVQIRNMGTLGGNVCNASPAADGALGLIALDASVNIAGQGGERSVEAYKFFTGPGASVLEKGEIVTGFTVPVPDPETGSCFISIGRTSLDISTISIAVTLKTRGDVVEEARVALGSVAPTPVRLTEVEEALKGQKITVELIHEAADMVTESIKPITDVRASMEYRREASRGLALEAFTRAWKGEGRTTQ